MPDDKALNDTITKLKSNDWRQRRDACTKLGESRDPRAVEPLIVGLRNGVWSLRKNAAEAIGNIGDTRAVEPLTNALWDENSEVRKRAAEALGKIGDPRAVGPLLATLKDKDSAVRRNAAKALAQIGNWEASGSVSGAELLEDIFAKHGLRNRINATFSELKSQLSVLLCGTCYTRLEKNTVKDRPKLTVHLLQCRICNRAATNRMDEKLLEGVNQVVAVLDEGMNEESTFANSIIRVNQLRLDRLFDFDTVEIGDTPEYDVERFMIDVGNDADDFRSKRYKKVQCRLMPKHSLSENTLRNMRDTFGEVIVTK